VQRDIIVGVGNLDDEELVTDTRGPQESIKMSFAQNQKAVHLLATNQKPAHCLVLNQKEAYFLPPKTIGTPGNIRRTFLENRNAQHRIEKKITDGRVGIQIIFREDLNDRNALETDQIIPHHPASLIIHISHEMREVVILEDRQEGQIVERSQIVTNHEPSQVVNDIVRIHKVAQENPQSTHITHHIDQGETQNKQAILGRA
jgi:hypothetical protein